MKKKNLRSKIMLYLRSAFLANSRIYAEIFFARNKQKYINTIDDFKGNSISQEQRQEILKHMKRAWVKFHWSAEEYFLYGYEKLTDQERAQYLSDFDRSCFCTRVNDQGKSEIFRRKWKTYEVFKPYFKREAVLIRGSKDIAKLEAVDFLERHNSAIMKPLTNSCGHGIVLFHANSKEEALQKFRDVITSNDTSYIMEELIEQSEDMAEFHPNSVNTVRMFTFKLKDEVRILYAGIRFGINNTFVDNAGSGGIYSSVDVATGKVCTVSVDGMGNEFANHPNSGKQILGFQIPKWEQLTCLAKELALIVPEVKTVGWDFALTDKGWVLVEGNDRAQFHYYQVPMRKGFMNEFKQIRKLM